MLLSATKDARVLFFKAKKPGLGAVMGDMFGDAPLADMPIMHRGHATKTGGYVAPFVEHHKVRLATPVHVAPPVPPAKVAPPPVKARTLNDDELGWLVNWRRQGDMKGPTNARMQALWDQASDAQRLSVDQSAGLAPPPRPEDIMSRDMIPPAPRDLPDDVQAESDPWSPRPFTASDGTAGMEFMVPMPLMRGLKARLDDYVKRSRKLSSAAPRLEMVGEPVMRRLQSSAHNWDGEIFNADMTVPVQTVRLVSTPIRIPGWTTVGALDYEHGINGRPVVMDLADTVPAEYRNAKPICDHCGTKRKRNMTFILRNPEGQIKQIGKDCLKDYTGHDPADLVGQFNAMSWIFGIAADMAKSGDMDDWDPEMVSAGREDPAGVFTPLGWLQRSAYMIRLFGFRKSGSDDGATWESVLSSRYEPAAEDEYRKNVTVGDKETAEAVRDWLLAVPDDTPSNFLANAKAALTAEGMNRRTGAILTATVWVWKKEQEKRAEAAALETQGPEFKPKPADERGHVGTIGKRQEFTVKLIGRHEYRRSPYGYGDSDVGYLHRFVTEDGNLMMWFATASNFRSGVDHPVTGTEMFLPIPTGHVIKIKATPKNHDKDQKDGGPVTIVNRVVPDFKSLTPGALEAAQQEYKGQYLNKSASPMVLFFKAQRKGAAEVMSDLFGDAPAPKTTKEVMHSGYTDKHGVYHHPHPQLHEVNVEQSTPKAAQAKPKKVPFAHPSVASLHPWDSMDETARVGLLQSARPEMSTARGTASTAAKIAAKQSWSDLPSDIRDKIKDHPALRVQGDASPAAPKPPATARPPATHTSSDGAPLWATPERHVYTDADGAEVEDRYAVPVKAAKPEPTPESLLANDPTFVEIPYADGKAAKVIRAWGRPLVVADINGVRVPFYMSTGMGGKIGVASGMWYPFFGFGPVDAYPSHWFNKGPDDESINSYYGSDELRTVAQRLDRDLGDVQYDETIPETEGPGPHIAAINTGLGIKPTPLMDVDGLRANVADVLKRIRGPQEGDTKTEAGVAYTLRGGRWHRDTPEPEAKPEPAAPAVTDNLLKLRAKIEELGGRQKTAETMKVMLRGRNTKAKASALIDSLAEATGASRDQVLAELGLKQVEKATAPAPKPAPAPAADTGTFDDMDPSSPNYRYRDTGYVAGSRKENAALMLRQAKRDGTQVRGTAIDWETLEQNPREAKEVITKSHLFGSVDWEALKAGGMEPGAGFLVDRIYAAVGAAPTDDTPQARQDYTLGLESLRDRLERCKTADEVTKVLTEIRDEWEGINLNEAEAREYADLGERRKNLAGPYYAAREHSDALSKEASRFADAARHLEYKKRRTPAEEKDLAVLKVQASEAWDKAAKFRADNPYFFEGKRRELGGGWSANDSDAEWDMRQLRNQQDTVVAAAKVRNAVESQVHRAWAQMGERFINLLNYRKFKGSDTFAKHVANAKGGRVKDWSWAEKEAKTAPRGASDESTRFQLLVADTYERQGGRQVQADSTDALKRAFGLREVQSGNWVLRDVNSAKFHTEQTAGALADLADLIGVPDQQIAMNGRLAMAFGARGRGNVGFGGGSRAHYESVERVINLTKMGGGGTLAHEWFHAMDNLLSEAMGGKADTETFLTEDPLHIPAGDLRDAFVDLRSALLDGPHRVTLDMAYTGEDYRTAKHNIERTSDYGMPVPAKLIRAAGSVHAAVQAVETYFAKEKQTTKNANLAKRWRTLAAAYYGGQANGGTVSVEAGPAMSSFRREAVILDKGQHGKYWSTPKELAARAFQAWAEDRLKGLGRRNDYLSAKAENWWYISPFGSPKPFPEGAERERTNAAFDRLMGAIAKGDVLAKALAAVDGSRVFFFKARGWFGPEHGGTHRKQAAHDDGKDLGGGQSATTLPSSADLSTLAEARAYWREHLGGKTQRLTARLKSGDYAFDVTFDDKNSHAYTRSATEAETPDVYDNQERQKGPRVYDAKRAQHMDKIPESIARPGAVLGSRGSDLYIGKRLPDGQFYVVVLSVKGRGRCAFATAQPRSSEAVAHLRRQLRPVIPAQLAPLRKAQKNGPTLNGVGPGPQFVGVGGMHSTQDLTAPRCPPHGYAAGTSGSVGVRALFFKAQRRDAKGTADLFGAEGPIRAPKTTKEVQHKGYTDKAGHYHAPHQQRHEVLAEAPKPQEDAARPKLKSAWQVPREEYVKEHAETASKLHHAVMDAQTDVRDLMAMGHGEVRGSGFSGARFDTTKGQSAKTEAMREKSGINDKQKAAEDKLAMLHGHHKRAHAALQSRVADHKQQVADAVSRGESVPADVLADYPDLAKPAPNPDAMTWSQVDAHVDKANETWTKILPGYEPINSFELFDHGLDEKADTWSKQDVIRAMNSVRKAGKAAVAKKAKDALIASNGGRIIGIEAKHNKDDRWIAIIPDASEPGRFRYSQFDKRGFYSHAVFDTAEEALDDAVSRGYTVPAGGTMDRFSVTDEWAEGLKQLEEVQRMNKELDARVKANRAAKAAKAAAKPMLAKDAHRAIQIAADSIEKLRAVDVDRVLDQGVKTDKQRLALANYIKKARPDLAEKVDDAMADLAKAMPMGTFLKAISGRKRKAKVCMTREEFEAEHARLLRVLRSPEHDDDLDEAEEQEKEVAALKKALPMVLFFKAIANNPGLALQDVTDKAGHQTKRWKRTSQDQPAPRRPASPQQAAPGREPAKGSDRPDQGRPAKQDESWGRDAAKQSARLEQDKAAHPPAQGPKQASRTAPLFHADELAIPKDVRQPTADRDALFAHGAEALGQLSHWLNEGHGVADDLGYKTFRDYMEAMDVLKSGEPGGMLLMAPLKSAKRSEEKVKADYDGDWSRLTDVVRASLAVDTFDELQQVLGKLRQSGLHLAKAPKDRFAKPLPVGYRDVLLNVTLPNGHVGELQVHVKPMLATKELVAHHFYEEMRSIEARLAGSTPGGGEAVEKMGVEQKRALMTADERKVYNTAFAKSVKAYNQAWEKATHGREGPMQKAMNSTGGGAAWTPKGQRGVQYFDKDGALMRRQSDGHWPEVYRPKSGEWEVYHNMLSFDENADPITPEEAKERMKGS